MHFKVFLSIYIGAILKGKNIPPLIVAPFKMWGPLQCTYSIIQNLVFDDTDCKILKMYVMPMYC